ncbi:hypothetical protein MRX96_046869 [Rhipicephalus microplus]
MPESVPDPGTSAKRVEEKIATKDKEEKRHHETLVKRAMIWRRRRRFDDGFPPSEQATDESRCERSAACEPPLRPSQACYTYDSIDNKTSRRLMVREMMARKRITYDPCSAAMPSIVSCASRALPLSPKTRRASRGCDARNQAAVNGVKTTFEIGMRRSRIAIKKA